MELAKEVAGGNRQALARLLTLLENEAAEGLAALDSLYPQTGKAHVVGITGLSGVGKSTLVNRLVPELAEHLKHPIAILAVDPSSPFSGGALLGDRVRMRDLAGREDIFIRSMATRGALGGLARASGNATLAMDAAGFGTILIETVGAGQAEVEVARLAHTTVVVEAPGLGDDIQAAKAGILEIADILVVNKADKPNAEVSANALRVMMEIGEELSAAHDEDNRRWHVPVKLAAAQFNEGVKEVAEAILAHKAFLKEMGGWERREEARARDMLERILQERLLERWRVTIEEGDYEEAVRRVIERKQSPRAAAEGLL